MGIGVRVDTQHDLFVLPVGTVTVWSQGRVTGLLCR
jgi:hypothetical protein